MKPLRDPRILRHFHAVAVLTWIALIVPTLIWWKDSVLWVALMSLWANMAAHWSAWQAARTESKQDESQGGGRDDEPHQCG
jgi:hypothetical protein